MYGWAGTILRINLTSGNVRKEVLDMEMAKKYVGGRGLGTKYMYDEVDPKVEPLGSENKLIFAAGPLNGTYAPSASHYDVVTKGPLNGTISASSSGGIFGPMLKYAGYDMIIFEGKAEKPVYVWINNDEIEIRSAEALWGTTTDVVTGKIREETDEEASVACIGPGGENLILFANVMNEVGRAAGRSGVGAVMGSKNLKAVAVRGTGAVKVADIDAFKKATKDASDKIYANEGAMGLGTFGTVGEMCSLLSKASGLPTRNFRGGYFAESDKIAGIPLNENNMIRTRACYSCIIGCGRATKVKNPKYEGFGEGPEYETAWAFGPLCGIDDLDAITKANYICNEYSVDTITMGSTIACAMDMFEDGVISTKDTDGIALEFGNAEAMVEMVRKTATGEGFGKKLALGSYRLAESYGHPEYSMSVKKQEMPGYEPRPIQGIGLNYATSNRGGCHVRGYTIALEILGDVDPLTIEGKAEMAIAFQNLTSAIDASGSCLFVTFGIAGDELSELMSTVTGINYSTDDFLEVGERIWNLERLFNLKAGLSAKDDTLPERLLKTPMPDGPAKGNVNRLPEMLPDYYSLRGWDKSGVPTPEKLQKLGI